MTSTELSTVKSWDWENNHISLCVIQHPPQLAVYYLLSCCSCWWEKRVGICLEQVSELQPHLRERSAPQSSFLYHKDLATQQVISTNRARNQHKPWWLNTEPYYKIFLILQIPRVHFGPWEETPDGCFLCYKWHSWKCGRSCTCLELYQRTLGRPQTWVSCCLNTAVSHQPLQHIGQWFIWAMSRCSRLWIWASTNMYFKRKKCFLVNVKRSLHHC